VLEKTSKLLYPTNVLRNVAMEGIESHYVVAMDVDLIPLSRDCHGNLVSTFSRIQMGNKKDSLFVLPAFSLFQETNGEYATADMLPLSKRRVVNIVKKKKMDHLWKGFAVHNIRYGTVEEPQHIR
jgi:hypothetical protein